MSRFRLTRRADQNVREIYLYTAQNFGLEQADRYAEDLERCFGLLADNPKLGRSAEAVRAGLRRHEHAKHVIFYRDDESAGGILILTVVHERSLPRLDDLS